VTDDIDYEVFDCYVVDCMRCVSGIAAWDFHATEGREFLTWKECHDQLITAENLFAIVSLIRVVGTQAMDKYRQPSNMNGLVMRVSWTLNCLVLARCI
jgi:hypothetical protein